MPRYLRLAAVLSISVIAFGCAAQPPVTDDPRRDMMTMAATAAPDDDDHVALCSFNIQFLGLYAQRQNEALADLVQDYDLVVVQELIHPPHDGKYPRKTADPPGIDLSYTGDPEAKLFFDAMTARGFEFSLSNEDTGPGAENRKSSSVTEWFVVFYKPAKLTVAADLPNRFIGRDRSGHAVYRRVPFAHSFRTLDGRLDFVVVNVHLWPDKSIPGMGSDREVERKAELDAIDNWVDNNDDVEKDFLIVGDMNINDAAELASVTPSGWVSSNDEVHKTNTAAFTHKPYDHVMFRPAFTQIDATFDQVEIDLVAAMEPTWTGTDPYPGNPYVHNDFRRHYSDHRPIVVRLVKPAMDDD